MNRTIQTLKEWINPAWGHHRTVPPLDAGLRPNGRLDDATPLLPPNTYDPDAIVVTGTGAIAFSSGDSIVELRDGATTRLASFGGAVTALVAHGEDLVAAVDGRGIVVVRTSGAVGTVCDDATVARCVTDLAVLPDGSLLATVGSRHNGIDEWAHALVRSDRSGLLVRIDGETARVEADGLTWPAGVAVATDTEIVLALSLEHRIEVRALSSLSRTTRTISGNLPVYPGRLTAVDDGWWVAAPYVRNRVVEMLLDEPEVLEDMATNLVPEDWFVPRLRCTNPYTDTMQMGQLRVLGVIKPWAPTRSGGVAFRIDRGGRLAESAHAGVDSDRHGVTGIAVAGGTVVAAVRGFANILALTGAD